MRCCRLAIGPRNEFVGGPEDTITQADSDTNYNIKGRHIPIQNKSTLDEQQRKLRSVKSFSIRPHKKRR